MAFVIADRVRETTSTTGTGNLTLAGAVSKFRTFASVLSTSDTTYYSIVEQTGTAWEVGIGTFTSPSTLARTTILSSSNGGSAVDFAAGTKDVFITLPASKTNVEDQPNLIEVNSSSDALRITQTGAGNALVVEDSANPDATPFVVDASGNVGIGTSSPGKRLDVVGPTITLGSPSTYAVGIASTGGANGDLAFGSDATYGYIQSFGGKPLYINNQGNNVLFGSGNVGVGTTSPGERLQVSGGNFGVLGATSTSFTGIINQNNGASGSVYRGLFYDARNENGVAVANMLVDVNADGSSAWKWSTTPAGSRASDRRVDRAGITSTGDFQFNSGYGSVATAYGCRAWVNFNGTGTVAIRASGNVTSITDNGTGIYTINFTNAMPDVNYAFAASSKLPAAATGTTQLQNSTGTQLAGSLAIETLNASNTTRTDATLVEVVVFR